jgi:adhesin/invasin
MGKTSLVAIAAILTIFVVTGCGQSGQDTTAPEISDISTRDLAATSIVILWTTDEPATSRVDYGLTDSYGRSTSTGSGRAVSHSVTLMGLAAASTYHYRVYSEDASGNGAFSPDRSFSTPDIDAPLISEVAAGGITGVGATITWTTSEPATSQVDYGLTDQYGQSTELDTDLVISHSVSLTGLSAGKTYHYRVRSKDDSNHEGYSDDYTFSTGTAGYLVISPATAAVTAGSTRTYTAEAFDQFNNSLGNVTPATVFSIQSGAGGSWSGNVYTSKKPGIWTVTGTYTGLTGTATLTVSVGSVASIVISPSTSTVIAGNTQAYTAEAFDLLNNSLGVVTTGTIFSIDAAAGGSWVASVYTSRKAGTWTVTGSYAGRTDTATLTVTRTAPSSVVVSPDNASVVAGGDVTYTVEAFDAYGNSLGDVTTSSILSIDSGSGGAWGAGVKPDNVYTSQSIGTWTVTATYASIPSDTTTLTVTAGAASRIEISPAAATITAGGTQAYTTTAFDQSGNSLGDVTTSSTFSMVESGHGGTWTANAYTAQNVGDWTVRATYAGLTDDASLTVTAGPATRLELTPDGGVATPGVAFDVTVTAYDAYGNVATGYTGTVTFTSTDTLATLPAPFAFTLSDGGTHPFAVTLVMTSLSSTIVVADGTLTDSASWIVI